MLCTKLTAYLYDKALYIQRIPRNKCILKHFQWDLHPSSLIDNRADRWWNRRHHSNLESLRDSSALSIFSIAERVRSAYGVRIGGFGRAESGTENLGCLSGAFLEVRFVGLWRTALVECFYTATRFYRRCKARYLMLGRR
jgi:hypothetical protein